MKISEADNDLCRKFCSYYKPSKDEDLACKGYLVMKHLLRNSKKIDIEEVSSSCTSDMFRNNVASEALEKVMCCTCPFHEHDCDYADGREDAMPCGGFVFLVQLLKAGTITIDDIEDIN